MKKVLILIFFFLCLFPIKEIFSETKASETNNVILIGASNAQGGPAKFLGREYTRGFNAYFQYINEKGGIHGKKLKLIVYDDKYNPFLAIENTQKLINQDKVLLLTAYVGTPTSKAVFPIIIDNGIPFFFPFTGAGFLRKPVKKEIFNLRASYFDEVEEMVRYLHDKLGLTRIAILYQDDSFGRVGLKALEKALKKRGLKIVGKATYPRNTTAVRVAVLKLRKVRPQAVVLVGTYKPCALFIKLAKKLGMRKTKFINISFVGTEALIKELGEYGNGVLITQVVPSPWDTSLPGVLEYQKIMRKYYPDFQPSFVSLEGFLAAKVLIKILEDTGGNFTREAIIKSAENLKNYDIGIGVKVSFSPDNHQALNKVWISEIYNGKIRIIK